MASKDELIAERRKVADEQVAVRRSRANLAGSKNYGEMKRLSARIKELEERRAELTELIGDGR